MPPRWGLESFGGLARYKHVAPLALQREFARQATSVERLKTVQRAPRSELDA